MMDRLRRCLLFLFVLSEDGSYVLSPKRIWGRYLKGWFFIDVISLLPMELLFAIFSPPPVFNCLR